MADETPDIRTGMSRELGLVQITLMGMGMMIGAGVFIGIGRCLSEAGPGGVMLTFALNGIIAQRRIEEAVEAIGRPQELLDPKFVKADNVVEAILAETPEYDMAVLGASHERLWQQLVMGSIPEAIARRCAKPVAMVKAKMPLKSWVRKWI